MNLYEIILNDLLPVFISVEQLGDNIQIFNTIYALAITIVLVSIFVIIPFKVLKKIARVDNLNGRRKWKMY